MQRLNWSNIVLALSSAPSAVLLAYLLWYMLDYRPSGQEAWGDGATIFYLGALSYPISLLLLVVGTFMAVRWRRRHPSAPTAGPAWFALSVVLMVAPFVALLAVASYAGA
jgi:peptidoglycan biosynthesis protein MviN/MurJ (putative lipid II flippase)